LGPGRHHPRHPRDPAELGRPEAHLRLGTGLTAAVFFLLLIGASTFTEPQATHAPLVRDGEIIAKSVLLGTARYRFDSACETTLTGAEGIRI